MTASDWLFYFSMHVAKWLEVAMYFLGLSIAVWAFFRCRKRGYLVVALYFVIVLFSILVLPSVNQAIRAQRAPDLSAQTQQKINEAVQQAIDKVLKEEGHSPPPGAAIVRRQISLGPMVLVAGLWLIARRESREKDNPILPSNG